jgi:hypothetical protein
MLRVEKTTYEKPMKTAVSFCLAFCWAIPTLLFAQGSPIPRGNYAYDILDRLEITSGLEAPYHSSIKYYQRGKVIRFTEQLDTLQIKWSEKDREDLRYLFLDNNEWLGQAAIPSRLTGPKSHPNCDTSLTMIQAALENEHYIRSKKQILKWLYPSPANLLEVNTPAFHLRVNPLLNIQYGNDRYDTNPYFQYQRGVELRAGVDDRIFVYMNVLENQIQPLDYLQDWYNEYLAIPGASNAKPWRSNLLNNTNGRDFMMSDGYLGFNVTPHVGMQLGYGRNKIGNGYRSILLSDYASNYFFLKTNWEIWKFHFQNIFAELTATSPNQTPDNVIERKKYMAAHTLSINLTPKLNIGLFESVIFSRPDHFELQYLNPVILYRTVELGLGSPDNVQLGFDAKWNFLNHFQAYGQMFIDEFIFNQLFSNNTGNWANKYAVQAGLKYVNALGVDHLDLQVEYNRVRPFTYAHFDSITSYTNVFQPLAHPMGANFSEWIFLARYQPFKRLTMDFRLIQADLGDDLAGQNWGANLLSPNRTFFQSDGNFTGQGVPASTTLLGIDLNYRLAHNVFADLNYFYRRKDSAEDQRDQQSQFVSFGLRVNLGKLRFDF